MAARSLWQLVRDFLSWLFGWARSAARPAEQPKQNGRERSFSAAGDYTTQPDAHWDAEGKFPLDPRLRVVLAQLQFGNSAQIMERAGIDATRADRRVLRVFVEINTPLTADVRNDLLESKKSLEIPEAYLDDASEDKTLRVFPALFRAALRTIAIEEGPETGSERLVVDAETMRSNVREVVNNKHVTRLELAPTGVPCRQPLRNETLDDFDLPLDRKIPIGSQKYEATGQGVVIGVIDDGCALASWNFLSAPGASRIRYIWDQSTLPSGNGWTRVSGFPYGREMNNTPGTGPIDVALALNTSGGVIDEENVYKALDFPPPYAASHGSHVMDIAAGNGTALSGREGVAPQTDLIFVQLPPDLVEAGGPALFACIADGADYIFQRAKDLEVLLRRAVPAVVNISFANYAGPHDGTSLTEIALDAGLKADDRAIVMAAGNGFAAGCHAYRDVRRTQPGTLHWQVPSGDESANSLEIWYTGTGLELVLTPPRANPLTAVRAGDQRLGIFNPDKQLIGYIDHVGPTTGNGDGQILVTINGTMAYPGSPPPATAGTWLIELRKYSGGGTNECHAWIERDEARRGDVLRKGQSRFADNEATPRYTISGIATGERTIAVGAYDSATNEIAEYSGCGPARANRRPKPELCAPCASDARGRGVISASLRSQSKRMSGTSASAPHVAGLAALALQLNRTVRNKPLSVKRLRKLLVDGAAAGGRDLRPNRHQLVDAHQPIKQSDNAVKRSLVGAGRADALETLKKI